MGERVRTRQENYPGMFNLTKGIMMLVVMAGHSMMNNRWTFSMNMENPLLFWIQLVTCASMPMFFMLCGYTVKKKPRKACIKAQKVLLKPYFLVAAGVFVVSMGCVWLDHGGKRAYWDTFLRKVFPYFLGLGGKPFYGIQNDGIGAIWFFVAYVLCSIVLNEILGLEDMFSQVVVLAAMAIAGIEMGSETAYVFYLPQVLICTGYMYAGMLCKKYDIFNRNVPVMIWALMVAGWLYMVKYSWIMVASNVWEKGMTDVLLSYGAGLCMLVAFQKLNWIQGGVSNWIRWIGRHAMYICCIHSVTQIAIPWTDWMPRITHSFKAAALAEFAIHLGIAVAGCYLIEHYQKWKKHKRKVVKA